MWTLIEQATGWLQAHAVLLWWLGGASAVMLVAIMAFVIIFIARIPPDYFSAPRPPLTSLPPRQRVRRVFLNIAGTALILLGIPMLVLPGQGVLSILVGLSLTDFPGKRRLLTRIVRQPQVRATLNWIRRRADRPPLETP